MGYKNIKLKDGTTRNEHRLIFEKQIGRKLTYNEIVHHKNEDKGDNDPGNLELKTRSEHSREHMKKIKKVGTPNKACRKLSEEQVIEIFKLREKGYGYLKISKVFGVDKRVIKCILKGICYKEIFQSIYGECG